MHLTQMFARFDGDGVSDISTFGCLSSLINAQLGPGRGLLRNKQIEELIDFEDKQPLGSSLIYLDSFVFAHDIEQGLATDGVKVRYLSRSSGLVSRVRSTIRKQVAAFYIQRNVALKLLKTWSQSFTLCLSIYNRMFLLHGVKAKLRHLYAEFNVVIQGT